MTEKDTDGKIRRISRHERDIISRLWNVEGLSSTEIARQLNFARPSISAELRRGAVEGRFCSDGRLAYDPEKAQAAIELGIARRREPKKRITRRERGVISRLWNVEELSKTEIARQLERDKTTIIAELKRGAVEGETRADGKPAYDAAAAQAAMESQPYRQMTAGDRDMIAYLWNTRELSQTNLAEATGFERSHIIAELKRGKVDGETRADWKPAYDAVVAQAAAVLAEKIRRGKKL